MSDIQYRSIKLSTREIALIQDAFEYAREPAQYNHEEDVEIDRLLSYLDDCNYEKETRCSIN